VGAGGALNTVLKALLDPGDEVITVAPFFAEYVFYAENHGGRLVVVPPRADLTPDVAKLEAAITSKTRAILLNSPNNPSGVIYPASTFVEIEAGSAAPRSRSCSSAMSLTARSSSTTWSHPRCRRW
jgi:aspartate aminotransferase